MMRTLSVITVVSSLAVAGTIPTYSSQEITTPSGSHSRSEDNNAPILNLTPQEEERLIEETAKGLEALYVNASTLDTYGNIINIDIDTLYAKLQEMGLDPVMQPRSWQTFGTCLGEKIGISDGKEIARIIFNDQVKKFLKSHAWRKASAYIVQQIKKVAKQKGASWAVKKLAHKLLPGGLIGEIAVGATLCGAKEGWNWWRS